MAKSLNDLTDGELHDVSKNALVVAQASRQPLRKKEAGKRT